MSHDEHGQVLARWLDQPDGAPAPSELDADVVEAIVALRPERAPAPRVTADEILGLVSTGPLAAAGAEAQGGEVVPFPGGPPPAPVEEAVDHATPDPPPRWSSLARWGGVSGIGIALAAAATLMFVAVPTLQRGSAPMEQGEQLPVGDEMRAAPAAAAPAAREEAATEKLDAALEDAAEEPAVAAPPARQRAAKPTSAPPMPAAEPVPEAEPVYQMGGAPVPNEALIPELADDFGDGAAEADLDDMEAEPTDEALDLDALRASAVPRDWSGDRWQGAVSASDRERVSAGLEAARDAAQKGDAANAADLAERFISPPDAAAHAAALAAVEHHLAAGNGSAAIAAARRGLQYRTNTPEWSQLAVRLADLLRASDPQSAAAWYRDAAAQNAAR